MSLLAIRMRALSRTIPPWEPGRVLVEDDAPGLSRKRPGAAYFLRPKSGIDNCSPPLSADSCATIPGAV